MLRPYDGINQLDNHSPMQLRSQPHHRVHVQGATIHNIQLGAPQTGGSCLAQRPPQGGGGYIRSMNIEDLRQVASHDDPHRVRIYEDILHSKCLSSQHSTKPDIYDVSDRVSLPEGTYQVVLPEPHSSVPAPAASTDQIKLYENTPSSCTRTPSRWPPILHTGRPAPTTCPSP